MPGVGPISFFEFGMDRDTPEWVGFKMDLPILHLGPGVKGDRNLGGTGQTYDLEYPQYDFDSANPLDPIDKFMPPPGVSPAPFGFQMTTSGPFWPANSVGGIIATHVLEHLRDPRPLIWECARVLAPGCPMNIVVPLAGSNIANQDLDHKTPFVLDTWRTLLDSSYYKKGKKDGHGLSVGFNMVMSIKTGNEVLVTQLIKSNE
jgi:SAM-dependent methyltransferase